MLNDDMEVKRVGKRKIQNIVMHRTVLSYDWKECCASRTGW